MLLFIVTFFINTICNNKRLIIKSFFIGSSISSFGGSVLLLGGSVELICGGIESVRALNTFVSDNNSGKLRHGAVFVVTSLSVIFEACKTAFGLERRQVKRRKRIGQTFSYAYNYMRRHQLKFGNSNRFNQLKPLLTHIKV